MTKFSVLAMLSGSALATLSACSEPAPRIGAATVRFEVGQSQGSPGNCLLTVPVQTLPPDNQVNLLNSASDAAFVEGLPEVKDGENGDKVSCKVSESGGAVEFKLNIEKGPATLDMSGSTSGGGILRYRKSPELLNWHSSSRCSFTVDPDPTSEWAGSGSTKISFTCTEFGQDGNEGTICGVDGTFVARNCDQ